jgi:hypothetical protein
VRASEEANTNDVHVDAKKKHASQSALPNVLGEAEIMLRARSRSDRASKNIEKNSNGNSPNK